MGEWRFVGDFGGDVWRQLACRLRRIHSGVAAHESEIPAYAGMVYLGTGVCVGFGVIYIYDTVRFLLSQEWSVGGMKGSGYILAWRQLVERRQFGNSATPLTLAATMLARAAFLIFAPKNPHDFGDNFANLPITSFPLAKKLASPNAFCVIICDMQNKTAKWQSDLRRYLSSFLLVELCRGLALTFRHMFRRKITVQFPEEKTPRSGRFRGLHALRRYPNGEERCIACKLCEAVCPALAIHIESEQRDDGSRRTTKYDIDLTKCIFCGMCEEACPVDAIVETHVLEYHGERRGDLYYTKDMLLAVGDTYEKEIANARKTDAAYR